MRFRTRARYTSARLPRSRPLLRMASSPVSSCPPSADADAALDPPYREFTSRRDGMIHAMNGGLWLHRHVWKGRAMAHLVSVDREALIAYGRRAGIPLSRLQLKPLKDPRT